MTAVRQWPGPKRGIGPRTKTKARLLRERHGRERRQDEADDRQFAREWRQATTRNTNQRGTSS